MPLPRHPLDAAALARLSPAAQKAVAPGPQRLMAARGLVPLPRPAELVTVLYQLSVTDQAVSTAAQSTAEGLPEKVLAGAIADADIEPVVLDWLAPRVKGKPALFEALVLSPRVADATIADLAESAGPKEVDLIAGNEQRLLRAPDIIAAMYGNAQARMSTVDRAVELAVRNNVRVGGIAAWEELARVVAGGMGMTASGEGLDAVFSQALAGVSGVADSAIVAQSTEEAVEIAEGEADGTPPVDESKVPIGKMSVPAKIRLAALGNAFARSILIRDPMRLVALAAVKSPGITDLEAAKYAGNHALDNDVIRYIAARRDWTRLYGIKKSLVMNPKTPITESSKLLTHLRDNDIRQVAKSKGIPSAVVAQARRLITQRSGGGK